MIEFWFEIHLDWFRGAHASIGLGNGLAPIRWQAIMWTDAGSVHLRICAALVGYGF